ncbi:WYL domain-containing protein [Clostridium sp.]|uniref:helix-turn-helix transcriptional regulator n=1 Tax=Clostridium sp. TaxID=1506 RepID=UPI00260777E1
MEELRYAKVNRILTIFEKLKDREGINAQKVAQEFGVNEKTIKRDINDIRLYIADRNYNNLSIVYKRSEKAYFLTGSEDLTSDKKDILAICKILLESRAFCCEEMDRIINSVLYKVSYKDKKFIKKIIGNELLKFTPLEHKEKLIDRIWDLSKFIHNKEVIEIKYKKTEGEIVKRKVRPVSIIFSEYYFYLIVYFNNSKTRMPIVYRVDRIINYKSLKEKFRVCESERFQDGEFRKRIQFMYSGELMRVKFEFTGSSLEAVLDKLPTSRILESHEDKHIIEAEVYGKGIKMWLLSQGSGIKVLSPKSFVDEMALEAKKIYDIYNCNLN